MGLTEEQIIERGKSLEKLQITTYMDKVGYVFVSYKSDNWKKVFEEKVFDLQRRGLRVYSDKKFDDTNHSWLDDMDLNIKYASAVILFISKEYLKSYATLMELFTAIKYDKEIIPVYLEAKGSLFNSFKTAVELEKPDVRMEPAEAEQFRSLLDVGESSRYTNKMRIIKQNCESKIQKQKFSVMNIVESFKTILSDAEMKDNLFNQSIDSLVNTIKDAASRDDSYPDVFEDHSLLLENTKPIAPQTVNAQELSTKQNEEQQEDTAYKDDGKEDAEQELGKKKFSLTGDINYTLYNQKYTGNQADFMIQVFGTVLKKHQDSIEKAIEELTCLSATDYSDQKNRTDDMKSYFRICHTATFGDKQVCIGTAYNITDKLKLIAKLLSIVGEDNSVLQIEGMELPEINGIRKRNEETESYFVDGVKKEGNQSNMMFDVFEQLAQKHPEKIKELITLLSVKPSSKVEDPGTKESKPSYFRIYREYEVLGEKYCVGTAFGKQEKINQICKMIQLCGESDDFFQYEGMSEQSSSHKKGRKQKDFQF